MTLSLFDDEPTAGEAAATATAATFDQPFDPRPEAARARLQAFLPQSGKRYAAQRNFDFGPGKHQKVSALSPWLRHRIILETEVLEAVLGAQSAASAEKFIQEVFWRGYFKGWLEHRPEVWQRYRRRVTDLLGQLETDTALHARYEEAVGGHTGIACFDAWVQELVEANYLHNHARMWFASIWIFTLRLPWELGADFFFRHLLDGDAASNTCSWRWVGGCIRRARPTSPGPRTSANTPPDGSTRKASWQQRRPRWMNLRWGHERRRPSPMSIWRGSAWAC